MLRSTSLATLKGDLFGGITAGIIALPLALAFGVASGLGAEAGLYGAIILGLLATLFGGTPTQISGPTGPMTVIIASAALLFAGDTAAIMATVLFAGLFQIALGMLHTGKYVRFIPYPVISGFMSGVGMIIILLQLNPLLGAEVVGSTVAAVATLPATLWELDAATLAVSLATLAIVFFTPASLSRILPAPLIALVGVTALVFLAGLEVATIGAIPTGFPQLQLPDFSADQLKTILTLALPLALLGAIDTLLTSLVADSITKTRHNPDRELIGQGIGNSVCAFFGAVPGAGATIRTVVNIKVGATGRLSGVVHSLLLLSLLIGFAPLASHIPLAVLAGILVKVGVDILDYRLLRILKAAPRHDLYVMGTVFFLTVFIDLIVAVGAGVTLASILITYRIAKESHIVITEVAEDQDEESRERALEAHHTVRVIDITGPFFFGSSSHLVDRVDAVLGTKIAVIDCSTVPFMDLSAVFALEEMIERLSAGMITVLLVINGSKKEKLLRMGAFKQLPPGQLFFEREAALAYAAAWEKRAAGA
jgi:SulP family sulfate permease